MLALLLLALGLREEEESQHEEEERSQHEEEERSQHEEEEESQRDDCSHASHSAG